jgi:hypothetical protein
MIVYRDKTKKKAYLIIKKLAEYFQPSCQKPARQGRGRGKGKGKVITKQGLRSHSVTFVGLI